MNQSIKVIISGGGTGGHIYPALAIADRLKTLYPQARFLFVGAKGRMEMEKVPQAGYPIEGLWISGIQRKRWLKNLNFPFKLICSLLKAGKLIKKFKPDIAIGTGGFASGPALIMASRNDIPILLQEQNSYPGITNRLLAKKADKICVAYDNLERFFPDDKLIKTGNPIREELLSVETKTDEAVAFFKLDKTKKTLLVLGGSLGARSIDRLVEDNLDFFQKQSVQVIWQCGKLYIDDYQKYNQLKDVQVYPFLNRMDLAYSACDIIVSRAGAIAVSELCVVGKPVIFIPSPNVAEDHQTKNAKAIADKKAAILLKEDELTSFPTVFKDLLEDEEKRSRLGEQIKKLALPKATQDIVKEIEKLLNR